LASLVLNVPYGGLFMPPAVSKRLGLKPEELGWEHFRLADPCLLKVIASASEGGMVAGKQLEKPQPKRALVSYSFSPLVSDPLGILSADLGEGEPGNPSIIAKSTMGKPLVSWKPEDAELILKKSSLPYLKEIKDRCLELLDKDSLVLLLTLRSFSSKPWTYENERRYPRPQLDIGALNESKTPKGLASFLGKTFKTFNLWPELDWPHKGAYVPKELMGSPRLLAATLSFRRDLYMDEATGKITKAADSLARVLKTVFCLLEDELESVIKVRHRRKYPPKPPSMVIKAPKKP
jgi:hypothetical protein